MMYILIIVLIVAQILVVYNTYKKTKDQKKIFEKAPSAYKVEKFYIPKKELSTIDYEKVAADSAYKYGGDTVIMIPQVVENPFTGEKENKRVPQVICKKADKIVVNLVQIFPSNEVSTEIQRATNNYLIRNKGAASDYSLIKDIVERNCNTLEEEVATQTPWPLYFGLMGTMAGIILGIGSIALSPGGFAEFIQHSELHIGNLMGDIATAMIVSFVGIGLTTFLSYIAKQTNTVVETKKNLFYSWFQAELMPIITKENATEGLQRLEKNLESFNKSFETNVKDLNKTFALVKETSKTQATMLTSLEKLDLKKMAESNVTILTKFNETVGHLEEFNECVNYVKKALAELDRRSDAVREATIAVDTNLDKIFNELTSGVDKQVNALRESLTKSSQEMEKLIAAETRLVGQEGSKIDLFLNTVKSLEPIIKGLNDWKKELRSQTSEIARLASAINNMPAPGGTTVGKPSSNKSFLIVATIFGGIIAIILGLNIYFTVGLSKTMNEINDNQKMFYEKTGVFDSTIVNSAPTPIEQQDSVTLH